MRPFHDHFPRIVKLPTFLEGHHLAFERDVAFESEGLVVKPVTLGCGYSRVACEDKEDLCMA